MKRLHFDDLSPGLANDVLKEILAAEKKKKKKGGLAFNDLESTSVVPFGERWKFQ